VMYMLFVMAALLIKFKLNVMAIIHILVMVMMVIA